jgi:hypothetical protein
MSTSSLDDASLAEGKDLECRAKDDDLKESCAEAGDAYRDEARLSIGAHMLVIERHGTGGLLKLIAPDGTLPLEISITNEGAVLRLGRGLAVSVNGPLTLNADALSIHAREGIDLKSDGALALRAAGDILVEGDGQTIVARRGNVDVRANDDVTLKGERIKMNC